MNKIVLTIMVSMLATTTWAQQLDRSIRPKPGPAPEIKLGNSESFTLPNGLKVYVVENHKLPTISCTIQLDIKPELENEMAGYRDMMSELMTSGTKTRSNDKLSQEIDFIGAHIGASDEGVSGHALTKHMDKLLELMSDVTINADFKAEELEKIRTRTLSGLETQKNEPDAMLNNVSAVLNYGKNFPYGQVNTPATVKAITLDVCKKYYATYFHPNVAYMAIVGDVTMKEMKPLIEKYFGGWQKAEVPKAVYGQPSAPPAVRIAYVPREAAVQSVINVTYPIDLKPGTEDVIKTRVANTVLGGGSQGRLFLNLREKHAWTYGSYSSIKDDELEGNFTAYAKCRNVVTDSSIGEIISEMYRLQNEKVDNESLQSTITYMSGNFAIALEDPARIAQFAINIERYNMPKDYYKNYLKNLSGVTADDVQAMAKKYIRPDIANIVVVGHKDEAKKLTKYAKNGVIEYYDNYGNTIKMSETEAAPAGVTAATVYKNYITAIGGEKAISGIKDIKIVATAAVQNIPITLTEVKKAPGKMKKLVEGTMNGKTMTFQKQVFDGTKGYGESQGQKMDMDADDIEEAKEDGDIALTLHPEKYGIKRTLKGMENGAYVLDVVYNKNKTAIEYYDSKTGLLIKKVVTQVAPQGTVTQTSTYADYKDVPGTNGYKVPYAVSETAGPQTIMATVILVEVNKNIPDSEFN